MKFQKRLFILLLLTTVFLLNGKINLQKGYNDSQVPQKIHELEKHFGITPQRAQRMTEHTRANNRLLVLMVDFVEDDDPQTTGNGKFQFSDPDYPIDLGKPPHDQEYFWWVMESVRYYYQAASLGAFNLQFDIFPQAEYAEDDTAIVAYTLPHEMSYYNPPGADTDLMISRFEEYFFDVFTTVDSDEAVDFSRYHHFMIIHAGSDSQHDISGNTPADIPSFFINVGDGKEVIVDDGIVIDHACNVPATISQDGQYGVTTAVTAHEFGHSLGFIDLYSTLTGAPQVGWFDIMDSGGMGELIVDEVEGELISIEGGLPALPNAWHRILAWEDYFRERGILKNIDQLNWQGSIRLNPAEKIVSGISAQHPYFIKIPLTDTEYLLIENRQVDPDGDSGLSFKGGLAQYPDEHYKGYRILLYPTYPAPDPRDDPNWEYDLFIPGWQGEGNDGRIYNYGGGLVIWHIDDNIIYNEGEWIDGEFYSNYDRNTVNALHSRRGVKVVEADGFDNIGNYSDSYNILGSAYDPFYKYYPRLDANGNFLGWDSSGMIPGFQPSNSDDFIHTVEFHAASQPQLITNSGEPFMFGLWDISSYSLNVDAERYMSFRYGSHLFDEIDIIEDRGHISAVSAVMNDHLGFPGFIYYADDKWRLQTLIGEEWANHFAWEQSLMPAPTLPIVIQDEFNNGEESFITVSDSIWIEFQNNYLHAKSFDSALSDIPLAIDSVRIVPLHDKLVINGIDLAVPDARISYDGEYLIAASMNGIYYIDIDSQEIISEFELPESVLRYYPVIFKPVVTGEAISFMITENGVVYKFHAGAMERIFDCSDYTSAAPSQILLTNLEDEGRTWLMFAAGEYLFAITDRGTLLTGFPRYMENRSVAAGSWLSSMKLNAEYLILMQRQNGSQFAVNQSGEYRIDLSSIQPGTNPIGNFWYDELLAELNWIGVIDDSRLIAGKRLEVSENPVINQGYRNEQFNCFTGVLTSDFGSTEGFRAFAFPNPANGKSAVLRIFQAEDNISVKLYDIAGNLVLKKSEEHEEHHYQDIRLDISGISSGIYYARISYGTKSLTVPLGIEK